MGVQSRIASRYASALFDLAREQGRLDAVYRDLSELGRVLAENRELELFITDPSVPAARALKTLSALFEQRVDPLTFRFLRFLVDRNRLAWLSEMPPVFERHYDRHQGQLRVDVVSAVPLDAKQRDVLAQKLKRRFHRDILARYEEDPRLVGGFRVRVGDTIHDYSVAAMLETFKQKLMNA